MPDFMSNLLSPALHPLPETCCRCNQPIFDAEGKLVEESSDAYIGPQPRPDDYLDHNEWWTVVHSRCLTPEERAQEKELERFMDDQYTKAGLKNNN